MLREEAGRGESFDGDELFSSIMSREYELWRTRERPRGRRKREMLSLAAQGEGTKLKAWRLFKMQVGYQLQAGGTTFFPTEKI